MNAALRNNKLLFGPIVKTLGKQITELKEKEAGLAY
jgi:hypothetical protein